MFIPTLLMVAGLSFSGGVNSIKSPTRLMPDTSITNTYDPNLDLIGDYIVNAYINDLDTLQSYSESDAKPANAICYINEDGYMTDKDGRSFGEPFSDIYGWYLKDKMIPIFYVSSEGAADSLIAFYQSILRYDMGVMSTNPALISKVKAACPSLHGVLDYSYKTDSELSLKEMVATTHEAGANTIVVSPSFATYQNMFYIHARFKTVWVNDSNADDVEILRQVTDGAYGCIVNNPLETFELLKVFSDKSVSKKYNYNRPIMNVAHRGLCQTMWENSLEGCIAAYENGATHFEIDIQVTKDKKLAIMHDDTIDRTTTGTGRISDYTAEELKQFKIDSTLSTRLNGEGVAIPMLDDFFTEFKGKNIVIIIEIKTSDINCVSILKEYLDAADIKDQVVVISFYTAQLMKMKQQIPEVPTADLNSYSSSNFINSMNMLGNYNMTIDPNYSNYSTLFGHMLAERGFSSWFWTFDNQQTLFDGMKKGVLGVTNNMADSLKNFPTKLAIEKTLTLDGGSFEDVKVNAKYINYLHQNSEEELEATPLFIKNKGDGTAQVIFQAKYVSGSSTPKFTAVLFSDVVTVTLNKPAPTSSKGCGGSIEAASSTLISLVAAFGILVIVRRKREHC